MLNIKKTSQLSLIGEIITIFKEENNNIARIHFKPGYLEFPIDPEKEFRLGDIINIKSTINIENIEENIENAQ